MENITITLKDLEKENNTNVAQILLRDSFYAKQAIDLLKDSKVDSLRELVISSWYLDTKTLDKMAKDKKNKDFISLIIAKSELDADLINQLVLTVNDDDKLTIIEKHFKKLTKENILTLLFLDSIEDKTINEKIKSALIYKYRKLITEEIAYKYIKKFKSKESMYNLVRDTDFSEDFYDFILDEVDEAKEVMEPIYEYKIFNGFELMISEKKNLSQKSKLSFIEKLVGIDSEESMKSSHYYRLMSSQFSTVTITNFLKDEVVCIKFLEKLNELKKTHSYKSYYKYNPLNMHEILVGIAKNTTSEKVLELLSKTRTASKHFIQKAIERRDSKKDITVKEAIENKTALNKKNDYGFSDRFYIEDDKELLPSKSLKLLEILEILNENNQLDDFDIAFSDYKERNDGRITLILNSKVLSIYIDADCRSKFYFFYDCLNISKDLLNDMNEFKKIVSTTKFQEDFRKMLNNKED